MTKPEIQKVILEASIIVNQIKTAKKKAQIFLIKYK